MFLFIAFLSDRNTSCSSSKIPHAKILLNFNIICRKETTLAVDVTKPPPITDFFNVCDDITRVKSNFIFSRYKCKKWWKGTNSRWLTKSRNSKQPVAQWIHSGPVWLVGLGPPNQCTPSNRPQTDTGYSGPVWLVGLGPPNQCSPSKKPQTGTGNTDETYGGYGGESLPNLENWPSRRAEVAQCISAGQLTGPRTIGQLQLLKKVTDKKCLQENLWHPKE